MLHNPTDRPSARFRIGIVTLLSAALLPVAARAAVEWHPDLETAHAAAKISRRPVLAVFVASWDADTTPLDPPCLRAPEAEAALASGFEPVRIDVDQHPTLTRAAGVAHVPTACVLADDDAVLAAFELPATPPAFVAAANQAARQATTGDAVDAARRGPRSAARMAAKVRELSAFAAGQGHPDAVARAVAINAAPPHGTESDLGYKLVAWAAESAGGPAAPNAIQPAVTAPAPTTIAPWLDSAAARPAPTPYPAPAPATAPAAPTPAAALTPAPAAPPATMPAPATQPATPVAATPPPAAATQPLPPAEQPAPQPKTGTASLLAALQKPFAIFTKPTAKPAKPSDKPAAAPPATPAPAVPLAGMAPPVAAPSAPQGLPEAGPSDEARALMPLGLEGYCPVTLVDRSTWAEGRAQWGARHRGRTYLFAGPDEQRAFLADPDRYAPALSGDDPVLALDRRTSTPGQRRYGVTYQARMYLFAGPETLSIFSADPARYAARVALAERTPARDAAGSRLY
ncbi:MAG: hypothetical protein ACKOZU_11230 [Planctomycetaceae bacterium]